MYNPELPKNCPLRVSDYSSFCPKPLFGPMEHHVLGECKHWDECCKLSRELLKDDIPTDTELKKI